MHKVTRVFLFVLGLFCLLPLVGVAATVNPMISTGRCHSLALDAKGNVSAWGCDDYGQLGIGRSTYSDTPLKVDVPGGVVQVALGQGFTVALQADGSVWTWGVNSAG
jgi:alpha-tubulin suppressor-like RCC1 family protein